MTVAESIWDKLTQTGITLAEAYKRLDRDLGKTAYKPVKIGGKEFTDIQPPYVYEVLAECFGPCGIGWGFEVEQVEYLGSRSYKSKSGNDVTEHGASAMVRVWYALSDADRYSWGPVPGGAKNSERAYAASGAVTNAIGKAFSFLGVQRHIYKNGAPDQTYLGDEPKGDENAEPLPDAPAVPYKDAFDTLRATAELKGTKAKLAKAMNDPKNYAEGLERYVAMSDAERKVLERIAEGSGK